MARRAKRSIDRRLYDLANARSFLRAAVLCLGYAGVYLRKSDDEAYEKLRSARSAVETLLQQVEEELRSYLEPEPQPRPSFGSRVRKIIEEVIAGCWTSSS